MSERTIQAEVMRTIGSMPDVRVFRNQVGVGWVGKIRAHDVHNQTVILENAHRVTMGLHVGSSDLIGWRRRIIVPSDVGMTFAQFLCVEVKSNKGRLSEDQEHWLTTVNKCGGLAFETRSANEAYNLLKP